MCVATNSCRQYNRPSCAHRMLRSAIRASRGVRICLQECATLSGAASASGRPDLSDVERLTRGEAAKRRGTGSRDVPHRLNADERVSWELAKVRTFALGSAHSNG